MAPADSGASQSSSSSVMASSTVSSRTRISWAERYHDLLSSQHAGVALRDLLTAAVTHHGCVTDQFRNTAAKPRSMTSVTTALPFLNTAPAKAGSNAKARDSDAREEESECRVSSLLGFGLRMSRASPRL